MRGCLSIGMGLKAAKTITDDMLEGKVCEIAVPDDRAELHATTLRILGAIVELDDPPSQSQVVSTGYEIETGAPSTGGVVKTTLLRSPS